AEFKTVGRPRSVCAPNAVQRISQSRFRRQFVRGRALATAGDDRRRALARASPKASAISPDVERGHRATHCTRNRRSARTANHELVQSYGLASLLGRRFKGGSTRGRSRRTTFRLARRFRSPLRETSFVANP